MNPNNTPDFSNSNLPFDSSYDLPYISPSKVKGYRIVRSLSSYQLFSIFAVDCKNSMLFCFKEGLDFDTAMATVEILNKPYENTEVVSTESL